MSYSTDLSDQQWALIEPLLPNALPGGRPRSVNMRRVVDAILYVVKTSCHWRLLPNDFPKWQTVYWYFKIFRQEGHLDRIMQMLVKKVRRKAGKKALPTIAIMDSQTVKTGKMVSENKGYDGGKHVKGRKRHLVVDITGMPLGIYVSAANLHDKRGGEIVLERVSRWIPSLKKIYADGGYSGEPFRQHVKEKLGAKLEIRKGIGKKFKGFKPIKKRWVVERSFAWWLDYRRLDKDQERYTWNSVAMLRWASIAMMLKRLFPAPVW